MRLLRTNPDPIKIVPGAQREAWHRQRGFRCDHEDGRGRCTSTETRSIWVEDHAEAYCEKHMPERPE